MSLKRLPLEVQSKLHALAQIRSFKTAVEELVYNALDASASSIALRINIKENYIQVVDNGHGIAKDDFDILGQRYTTSKYANSTSFESFETYGCNGQALANLIEVSQSVKIISKSENNEQTWMKIFCNGKEKGSSAVAKRPSVGTTVEIKGFLYNLTIQKKTVKELQELQNIKTFIEQVSLMYCNTSINLRDNSENEIIFHVHKNRDIIQTLSSVLSVDTANLQEIQVEKNQYKVTGFIQSNNEQAKGYQWIYVNGRCIDNSNLHNIVNENLAKAAPARILKTKVYNNEEERVLCNNPPDYFIFIKCPKNEYDIIPNPKHSMLEFKNVLHVNKLLEKLVKFHRGDMQTVKVINRSEEPINSLDNKIATEIDTRNKVKQLMQKILGSQENKLNGSDLHNGVRGKRIRRRDKKKVGPLAKCKLNVKHDSVIEDEMYEIKDLMPVNNPSVTKIYSVNNEATSPYQVPRRKLMLNRKFANANPKLKQVKKETGLRITNKNLENKYDNTSKQPVVSKFEKEADDVHKRCNILAKRVNNLLGIKKKRKSMPKQTMFTRETVQYSNIFTNNKSISVRKKINEIVIHEYVRLPKNISKTNKYDKSLKDVKKSKDLLHPVTTMFNPYDFPKNVMQAETVHQPHPKELLFTDTYEPKIPGPTYESHCYVKDGRIAQTQHPSNLVEKCKKNRFISRITTDDLASPIANKNVIKNRKETKREYYAKITNKIFTDTVKSSYSIHFTQTETKMSENVEKTGTDKSYIISLSNNNNDDICSTFIVAQSKKPEIINSEVILPETSHIDTTISKHEVNMNLNSELSTDIQRKQDEVAFSMESLHKTNLVFISNSQFSVTGPNSIEPLNMCEAVIGVQDKQDDGEFIGNTFIFDSINSVIENNIPDAIEAEKRHDPVATNIYRIPENVDCCNVNSRNKYDDFEPDDNFERNGFNLMNRRRYVPKGMSPIFNNCNFRNICDYGSVGDYFEVAVYNNFAQNIEIHSEIFEPKIQNVKEVTTRNVQRVDIKLNKNNSSHTFNAESLKHAKVLRQVDNKFIATIMNGDSNGANDCLVLFDQHAVHERIRLEKNMSEYVTYDQWKSIPVDDFTLKLSRDEILYLHNYREKFERLGLQWSIASDTQVLVTAIPEAILGKHQKQVEIVLKTVKNLIKEEINIMKQQCGSVFLYPKSIMDLVFSEACRYAIMFGTALSARECSALVEALSHCRTPFQCAHGRPALAVLVDLARETRPYRVNLTKVAQFIRKQKLNQ